LNSVSLRPAEVAVGGVVVGAVRKQEVARRGRRRGRCSSGSPGWACGGWACVLAVHGAPNEPFIGPRAPCPGPDGPAAQVIAEHTETCRTQVGAGRLKPCPGESDDSTRPGGPHARADDRNGWPGSVRRHDRGSRRADAACRPAAHARAGRGHDCGRVHGRCVRSDADVSAARDRSRLRAVPPGIAPLGCSRGGTHLPVRCAGRVRAAGIHVEWYPHAVGGGFTGGTDARRLVPGASRDVPARHPGFPERHGDGGSRVSGPVRADAARSARLLAAAADRDSGGVDDRRPCPRALPRPAAGCDGRGAPLRSGTGGAPAFGGPHAGHAGEHAERGDPVVRRNRSGAVLESGVGSPVRLVGTGSRRCADGRAVPEPCRSGRGDRHHAYPRPRRSVRRAARIWRALSRRQPPLGVVDDVRDSRRFGSTDLRVHGHRHLRAQAHRGRAQGPQRESATAQRAVVPCLCGIGRRVDPADRDRRRARRHPRAGRADLPV
jgi:hypothetical protein